MIEATPNAHIEFSTRTTPFGAKYGDRKLFAVCKGINIEDALAHATELLGCASATTFEIANILQDNERSQVIAISICWKWRRHCSTHH
ncbi:hypothetical protein D3C80_1304910 [compost metagenome]